MSKRACKSHRTFQAECKSARLLPKVSSSGVGLLAGVAGGLRQHAGQGAFSGRLVAEGFHKLASGHSAGDQLSGVVHLRRANALQPTAKGSHSFGASGAMLLAEMQLVAVTPEACSDMGFKQPCGTRPPMRKQVPKAIVKPFA